MDDRADSFKLNDRCHDTLALQSDLLPAFFNLFTGELTGDLCRRHR